MRSGYNKLVKTGVFCTVSILLLVAALLAGAYFFYAPQLPEVSQLKDFHLQTPLRIYSHDGLLIAEFGDKRRTPVTFDQIPAQLTHAFIAAEDADFYTNSGIDVSSLFRAAWELVSTGHIRTGGSTITMQVARNFFLSPERAFSRKFKEILLALRMTKVLTKQEIMTLYLNKIYLGNRAYGVQAAANAYYGKSIEKLNLSQIAMIAGLPKAPSAYNPIANPERALQRRNWILSRMLKLGYINEKEWSEATSQPVSAVYHRQSVELKAPYVAEMVRLEVIKKYGENAYTDGLKVYTTIQGKAQKAASQAVISGLESYDRRHGYRGPEEELGLNPEKWQKILEETDEIANVLPAIVTQVNDDSIHILLKNGKKGVIPWSGISWASTMITVDWKGKPPQKASDVLKTGDFIRVIENQDGQYRLAQLPQAQAALISISPENGAIRALTGGFDFTQSHFNRVTQAYRQVGSAIKPFIYSAALANGMTAATMINDAPVVIDNNSDDQDWRPSNDDHTFNGPMRLRQALYQSRNLVSIRILQQTGIKKTVKYIEKFGLPASQLPDYLSLALGAADMTPLQLATGYTVLANGGFTVEPHLIDRIVSTDGVIYEASPLHACNHLSSVQDSFPDDTQEETRPAFQEQEEGSMTIKACAPAVMTPQVNYIINSMMRDVIVHGTGRRAKVLGRNDLAGKTGTTNGHKDAWFAGYNPHLLTVVWVGKDNAKTLGRWEYGANAALPIWITFMRSALKGLPETLLARPSDIITVRIDKKTGLYTDSSNPDSSLELFRKQFAPSEYIRHASGNAGFMPGAIY